MRYQIIYLNGPSSSGKTTLAKALQEVLDPPFLHIGIDKIIGMMPEKINNWIGGEAPMGFSWRSAIDQDGKPLQELQVGPFARKVSNSYPEIVALLAEQGHSLIVDDVCLSNEELKRWRDLFSKLRVLYVGIKTSLPELERRELARGNRIPGSARAQFQKISYSSGYDLELDTSGLTTNQCVEIIQRRMEGTK
jgi:chloramphenicol 3-O phosphotransferase